MTRGHGNIIPFGHRPAAPRPAMLRCPVSASRGVSEAIALMWELRAQLRDAPGLRAIERTRCDTLGRTIEDRLEAALHSMERLP